MSLDRQTPDPGRIEHVLHERRDWLHSILASMTDAVITTDPNGFVTFLNPAAQSLTGWTFAETAGLPLETVFRIVNADSREAVGNPTVRALREGAVHLPKHSLLIAKDGTHRSINETAAPIRDANGEVVGMVLVFYDITERMRQVQAAQAALEASELNYRRLFESAKDGILILDADTGRISDANPFMCNLLDYEYDDFLGKELWEIGLFHDKEANQAAYGQLRERGYIRYENLPLRAKGGHEVKVEFVSNVYTVGRRQVAQCNIRDITERVRLERLAKVQTEALVELDRRKDEFLGMLSHELRNPLAAILNAVWMIRQPREEDVIQQQAKTILERQVGQLVRLVDDLLEVSRITTGRVNLHLERCEVRGIVERAVEAVRHEILKYKHDVSVMMPRQPIWLHADPNRLEQVVVNLLNNAVKYTDTGGHIELTVLQEGAEMVLRVRDTGIGIAPELIPRIFDLFMQVDRSLDRAHGGLGIGLTLVQRLVEMHRGTVEAHSAGLGQGSEFVVRLPVGVSSPQPTPSTSTGTKEPASPPLRVLVVDDNVDYAHSVATLLRASGYEIGVAHTGPEALAVAVDDRPDVVILDIGLPGMDGYEVARRIRQNPDLKDLQLVGVSGYPQETDSPRSQAARFDSYLRKPVLFDVLKTHLRI
jgi:PAS domain S-box-containing protein